MKGHTHRRKKEGADLHRPTNKQIDKQTYVRTHGKLINTPTNTTGKNVRVRKG